MVREGAAAPAGPVVPGGPHEDRAVLEQAMDDQPMDEERARGFANPNRPDEETVERHNLTHLPAAAWCDICVRSQLSAHRKEIVPRKSATHVKSLTNQEKC